MTDEIAKNPLRLDDLQNGCPGLSAQWGRFLCEASSCSLDFHKHQKGVELTVQGISDSLFQVLWDEEITEQMRKAWNDSQELAEYGACGVAILLILNLTNLTVIERARKGTGIDYWLGQKGSEVPFQNAARLEVSGILDGDTKDILHRITLKKKQTKPTDNTSLPAYIAVVEFSKPQSRLVQK